MDFAIIAIIKVKIIEDTNFFIVSTKVRIYVTLFKLIKQLQFHI